MAAACAVGPSRSVCSISRTSLRRLAQPSPLPRTAALSSLRTRLHSSVASSRGPPCGCAHSCVHSSARLLSTVAAPAGAASSSVMSDDAKYIVGTYARQPFEFVSGRGSTLVDAAGKRYIDFYSGIAVNALGHSHPRLCHVSNLYFSQPQVQLAKTLVTSSSFDKVFFCNSGTEANEAALKFARKYAYVHTNKAHPAAGKTDVLAFNGGFHGRTMGALAMTYKKAYKEPFHPLVPGVSFVDYNDTQSALSAVTDRTCAVIVEPVQGEGGVYVGTAEFLAALRRRCDEVGALLICDEVQVGLGRMGRLFCHEHFQGLQPDIVTLAKPLAGGLPIGAVLVRQKVADVMKPGDHGTTFAGGALVTAAAQATLDIIRDPAFLRDVTHKATHLTNRLRQLKQQLDSSAGQQGDAVRVVDIRSLGYDFKTDSGSGQGLLIGLELNAPVKNIITKAAHAGVVLISAGDNTLRLVPPLVITTQEIDQAVDVIADICQSHTVQQLK